MTPASIATLRYAMRLCDLSSDAKAHLAADMIRDVLGVDGEREADALRLEVAASAAPAGLSRDAIRMRTARANKRTNTANAFANNPNDRALCSPNVPNVPNALAPVSLSSPSEFLEESERETLDLGTAGANATPNERTNVHPERSGEQANTNERTDPPSGTRPVAELSSGVPGVRVQSEPRGVVQAAPDLHLIDPGLALSPSCRAAASMAGVVDVDTAWIAFVAHMISKGIRSADFELGEWPKWFVNSRKFEARDKARDAKRDPSTPEPPADVAQRRAAIERGQADRDRRDANYQSTAIPASLGAGGLMAAIAKRATTTEQKAG